MKKISVVGLGFMGMLLAGHASAAETSVRNKAPTPPPASEEQPAFDDKLLGDLGGQRSKLARAGVEVELNYSGDIWTVADGGKKRITTYLDFIELRTNLDNEKLFGLKGNTVSISVIDSNGTTTNGSTVGSVQGIDNSEVSANGVRIYEAWMQQNFLDDRLSVLVGLHDLNTEFAATPVSDNFLKPTMQIGQTFAQSGANGPSVFPTTSLAGRVKYKPSEATYVAAAVYDGVPGNPDRTSGSTVRIDRKDGLLLVAEAGWATEEDVNKLAIGGWRYTTEMPDLVTGELEPMQGLYVLSSYRFCKQGDRTVSGFLRGGLADGDTAQAEWDYELGLVANGWMPHRPDSEIGVGLSGIRNSDDYMSANAGSDRNEYSYELYYRDKLMRGVSIQPDMQYVVNPGTDGTTDDALVFGARLDISF